MEKSKFENLKVWKRSQELAVFIYKITAKGLLSKDYGLRDQMRRAAVSIASNIAEGDERDTDKESVRFFYIAKGSLAELRTQLKIVFDIGYIDKKDYAETNLECIEIGRMLWGLIKARSAK